MLYRQMARDHVDDRTRHKERRDPSRAILDQTGATVLNKIEPTNSRTDHSTDPLRIGLGHLQAGIRDSLISGRDAILDEAVDSANLLAGEIDSVEEETSVAERSSAFARKDDKIALLEKRVSMLEHALSDLAERLGEEINLAAD